VGIIRGGGRLERDGNEGGHGEGLGPAVYMENDDSDWYM
jgi:hypothetical protein